MEQTKEAKEAGLRETRRMYYIRRDAWIASGREIIEEDRQVGLWRDGESWIAIGFAGRALKPAFFLRFGTEERRSKFLADWVVKLQAKKDAAADRRAARNGSHTLKVGDILVSVWGYEQTNVDYYQVVACVSKTMVEIRPVGSRVEATGHDTGESVPVPGCFIGEARRYKVDARYNSVRISSFRSARLHEPVAVAGGVALYGPMAYSSYH